MSRKRYKKKLDPNNPREALLLELFRLQSRQSRGTPKERKIVSERQQAVRKELEEMDLKAEEAVGCLRASFFDGQTVEHYGSTYTWVFIEAKGD